MACFLLMTALTREFGDIWMQLLNAYSPWNDGLY
ncbi:hypothetical protein C4K38_1994 [Pseudomonas chlororaphis subsp. piscium]|nr:hypothetical protein C4K38_1994 [Pseudomonas chlororaphis subsp. piscium]